MTKIITKKGDVFCAALNDTQKKYFQFVGLDLTQLNSEVIRVFKKTYLIDERPVLEDVVKEEIDFYAHVVVKWGIQMKLWDKVGNVPGVGEVNQLFRASDDYGNPQVSVSSNWRIWKINEPFIKVSKLRGDYQRAEIGVVVAPGNVLKRMQTGKYDFVYPGFEA
jgi:hypothetical protein